MLLGWIPSRVTGGEPRFGVQCILSPAISISGAPHTAGGAAAAPATKGAETSAP
jgi:hypothetical protein